jgi:hypothetical protein
MAVRKPGHCVNQVSHCANQVSPVSGVHVNGTMIHRFFPLTIFGSHVVQEVEPEGC